MLPTNLIVPLEIAKLAFFVVYVAATVGVIVGVYWEGDQFPKEKQQRGWVLLVRSLAVDTLFTILVFGADGWISAIQRGEIIALETRLAPRSPSSERQARIVAALRPFAGQEYALSVAPGSEPEDFMCLIDQILAAAGWVKQTTFGIITVDTKCGTVAINTLSKIHVRVSPRASLETQQRASMLSSALNAANIIAEAAFDPKNIPSETIINVMIGSKPK